MSILNDFEDICSAQDDSIEFFLLKMVDLSSGPKFVNLKEFLAVEYDPYSYDDANNYIFAQKTTWFDKNACYNNVCISAGYGNAVHDFLRSKEFIIFIGTVNTGFKKISWDDFEMYVTMFRDRYGDIADNFFDRIYYLKETSYNINGVSYVRNKYNVEIF